MLQRVAKKYQTTYRKFIFTVYQSSKSHHVPLPPFFIGKVEQIYGEKQRRKNLPFTGSLPKWPPQPGLDQAEAGTGT